MDDPLEALYFFMPFQRSWNGVNIAGSLDVHLVTKCPIMYCEQTFVQRSANLCIHIYVETVCSSVNFHPNRQRPWRSFSRSKIWIEYIGKIINSMRYSSAGVCSSLYRHSGDGPIDCTNRHDVKGCQGQTFEASIFTCIMLNKIIKNTVVCISCPSTIFQG